MTIGKERPRPEGFPDLASKKWWNLFNRLISPELIESVLVEKNAKEKRFRKLPAKVVVLLVIGMGLFTEESIPQAFRALIDGIRFLGFLEDESIPKKVLFAKRGLVLGRG